MNYLYRLMLVGFAVVASQMVMADGDAVLSAGDPWVREAPPGARALGAFVTLQNSSEADLRLTGARSPAFERIELHRTVFESGMAMMQPQSAIIVPAHGEVVLKPGSYHMMLIGPRNPLKEGDIVPIEMVFDDGTTLAVRFFVRRAAGGAMGGGGSGMMDHQHMH